MVIQGSMPTEPAAIPCDVAIVGAGLGGITAAARVAEGNERVVLIEALDSLGGTAVYSGGIIHMWGDQTWEQFRDRCPTANHELTRVLFDNYKTYVDWLTATGAPGKYGENKFRNRVIFGYQIGGGVEPQLKRAWFEYLGRYIQERGGRLLRGTRAVSLTVADGRVVGLTAEGTDEQYRIRAEYV